MREDKEYPEIPRRKNSSSGDRSGTIVVVVIAIFIVLNLVMARNFRFESDGVSGKYITVDVTRERTATSPTPSSPPEIRTAAKMITAARELIEVRSYESAFNYCNEALVLEPDNMSAYVERGRACFYMHRYDEAIADLDKAIAAGVPELAVAYNARGCVYYDLKEYKKALVDLDEATRLDPSFVKPYANRALVYDKLADLERATAKELK